MGMGETGLHRGASFAPVSTETENGVPGAVPGSDQFKCALTVGTYLRACNARTRVRIPVLSLGDGRLRRCSAGAGAAAIVAAIGPMSGHRSSAFAGEVAGYVSHGAVC